jgi:hypothetical protein
MSEHDPELEELAKVVSGRPRPGQQRTEREILRREYEALWRFWIDPLNDDMEFEALLKSKLAELGSEGKS